MKGMSYLSRYIRLRGPILGYTNFTSTRCINFTSVVCQPTRMRHQTPLLIPVNIYLSKSPLSATKMHSFAQVTAYLQASLETVTKLASIIALWLLLIIADKHLSGFPIFEEFLWRSPRIPPRFNIKMGSRDTTNDHGIVWKKKRRHFAMTKTTLWIV